MPNKKPYENRRTKNGNEAISSGKKNRKGQNSGATTDFEKVCKAQTHSSSDFLKPYAPDFEISPEPIIRKTEDLLNSVRQLQENGDIYNPPEGINKFAQRITRYLKDQKLCVPLGENKRATSLTVIGDTIKFNVGTDGARSLAMVDKITIRPIPKRKRAPKRTPSIKPE